MWKGWERIQSGVQEKGLEGNRQAWRLVHESGPRAWSGKPENVAALEGLEEESPKEEICALKPQPKEKCCPAARARNERCRSV